RAVAAELTRGEGFPEALEHSRPLRRLPRRHREAIDRDPGLRERARRYGAVEPSDPRVAHQHDVPRPGRRPDERSQPREPAAADPDARTRRTAGELELEIAAHAGSIHERGTHATRGSGRGLER